MLPELAREGRKQLVGLMTDDPALVLEEGAQVTASAAPRVGSPALGHVTSSYRSPAPAARSRLRWSPAAARAWARQSMSRRPTAAPSPRRSLQPCVYDPEGARLHV